MGIEIQFEGAGPVKPEVVKKYFGVAKNVVKLVKGITAITKTKDDDAVVEGVEAALAFAEPYLDQEWVYDLVNGIVGLFVKDPVAAASLLKAAIAK